MGHDVRLSVVLPYWDSGDEHREQAFGIVRRWYKRFLPGAELVVCSSEPFSHAASRNLGVRRSAGEVVVMGDADSLVEIGQLRTAVAEARAADGIVVPFSEYLRLDEGGRQVERVENSVGGVVVYSRRTWEEAGGYDERFGRWGGDDAAFALAAELLVAPMRRLLGTCWHFWHEPQPESIPGHAGYTDQFAILGQYRDAADVEAMRDLVRARD